MPSLYAKNADDMTFGHMLDLFKIRAAMVNEPSAAQYAIAYATMELAAAQYRLTESVAELVQKLTKPQ